MDTTSAILAIVMAVAMIILIAPRTLALNRGNVLRNIALWLMIFTGLTLIYRNFGPDSPHPLFSAPARFSVKPQNNPAENGKSDNNNEADAPKGFRPSSQ